MGPAARNARLSGLGSARSVRQVGPLRVPVAASAKARRPLTPALLMRVESDTIRPPNRRNLSPGTPTRTRRRQADDPAPGIEALGLARTRWSTPLCAIGSTTAQLDAGTAGTAHGMTGGCFASGAKRPPAASRPPRIPPSRSGVFTADDPGQIESAIFPTRPARIRQPLRRWLAPSSARKRRPKPTSAASVTAI